MKTSLILSTLFVLACQLVSMMAYGASRQDAAAQYETDKRLCAEEGSSSARMQCLRDARAEYDRSLNSVSSSSYSQSRDYCAECGKVIAVNVEEKPSEGSAVGTIAGGVAGALVGNQVGQGTGRDLATIAGAVGGAFAGRAIEGKMKSDKVWKVRVRFDNGDERSYTFDNDPGLSIGTAVRASGNNIQRR